MWKMIKRVGKGTAIYRWFRNWNQPRRQKRELLEWEQKGRPLPPAHLIKQREIKEYAQRYGIKILVETGTYMGDMVQAMRPYFDKIYSIELSHELYENAKKRFNGDKRVEIIYGDSGLVLGKLTKDIYEPTLFWLDGHYSAGVSAKGVKDTPIFEELSHILSSNVNGHVLLIDDARCFGTEEGYPTIKELIEFIKRKKPYAKYDVAFDSVRVILGK